jgi:hypothetical protein
MDAKSEARGWEGENENEGTVGGGAAKHAKGRERSELQRREEAELGPRKTRMDAKNGTEFEVRI